MVGLNDLKIFSNWNCPIQLPGFQGKSSFAIGAEKETSPSQLLLEDPCAIMPCWHGCHTQLCPERAIYTAGSNHHSPQVLAAAPAAALPSCPTFLNNLWATHHKATSWGNPPKVAQEVSRVEKEEPSAVLGSPQPPPAPQLVFEMGWWLIMGIFPMQYPHTMTSQSYFHFFFKVKNGFPGPASLSVRVWASYLHRFTVCSLEPLDLYQALWKS